MFADTERGLTDNVGLKTNTHRRYRRDSTVELSRVGGVNAPVGSRDSVYTISCAGELLMLVTSDDIMNDVIVEKSYQYRSKFT